MFTVNTQCKKFQLHAEFRSSKLSNSELDFIDLEQRIKRGLNRIERVSAIHCGSVTTRSERSLQITFDTARSAVLGACEMQHRCAALPQFSGGKMTLNIGIHQGIKYKRSKDGSDSTIDIASLLAEIDNGIVTTKAVIASLDPELRKLANPLNGLYSQIAAHTIDWHHEIPSRAYRGKTIFTSFNAVAKIGTCLVLRYKLNVVELSQEKAHLTIGRDPQSDLVLSASHVSRNHCRVERRDSGFVLSDSSYNGTFIVSESGIAQYVNNEDIPLVGKGMFFCGRKFNGDRRGGVAYEVST